jgi:POT family proton-dependent oligopeptide transporter
MDANQKTEKTFMGQPAGLSTLFFTEMWERFSYYGMRAILLYYMWDKISQGGLGLPRDEAGAIMSIYGSLVYMSAVVGGWLSDRILGAQKTVLFGGIFIMLGHIVLGIPVDSFRIVGLFLSIALIVIGTGMLKPNVSGIVGHLYPDGDPRRDAGFSIFYFGINVGSFLAPIIVGTVGEDIGYHYGFGIAAIGMLIGLLVYNFQRKRNFAEIGAKPINPLTKAEGKTFGLSVLAGILVVAAIFGGAAFTGNLTVDLFINVVSIVGIALPVIYFVRMLNSKQVTKDEHSKVLAYIPLFISAIIFWAIEEQGSTILAAFAENRTVLNFAGIRLLPSWFQTLNPLFIILLTPLFVKLWTKMGDRQPSTVVKFSVGLLLTGASYLLMMLPGIISGTSGKVSPLWLVASWLIMMTGEMFLSPVGLAVTTKLAPRAFQGQTMAMWLLADSASQVINAHTFGFFKPSTEIAYFGIWGAIAIVFALGLFAIRKFVEGKMGDVR